RGYRLITLGEFLDGRITLPAGTTPVILTFDDSSPGQFRYLEQDGNLVVDPKSAVGILEAFGREHPDFGRGATFFVLPAADPPNRLFNQPEHVGRKLQFLVSRGYELGNHALWHANLGKYDEATVRAQIAGARRFKKLLRSISAQMTSRSRSSPLRKAHMVGRFTRRFWMASGLNWSR